MRRILSAILWGLIAVICPQMALEMMDEEAEK